MLLLRYLSCLGMEVSVQDLDSVASMCITAFSGCCRDALEWFASISPELACPSMTNPAEHLLEIIANAEPEKPESVDEDAATVNPTAAGVSTDLSDSVTLTGQDAQITTAIFAAKWEGANKDSKHSSSDELHE